MSRTRWPGIIDLEKRMKIVSLLLPVLFALSMVACSGDDDRQTTADPHDRLLDTQRTALEKARQVEGLMQDAKQQHDMAIEAQSNP